MVRKTVFDSGIGSYKVVNCSYDQTLFSHLVHYK